MAITATAQGKTFTFPDGTSPEQIGQAIDEFFAGQVSTPEVQQLEQVDPAAAFFEGQQQQQFPQAAQQQNQLPAGSELSAVLEPIAAIASGGIAEPIAGLAGLVASATPFLDEGVGARTVESVREALTFQPQTRAGQQRLQQFAQAPPIQAIASALEPVEGFAEFVGQDVATRTGLPAAGAIAKGTLAAIPDAIGFVTGLKGAQVGVDAARIATQGLDNAVKSVIGEPDIRVVDFETGQITPEAIAKLEEISDAGNDVNTAIANQLENQGVLTAEQAQRFNVFARRNVQPTRAQVTQSTTDFQQQQELAKTSNALADVLANQDTRLAELGREGVENIGPVTADVTETNSSLFNVIDEVVGAAESDVSKAYEAAKIAAPNVKSVSLDELASTLRRNVGSNSITKGLISAVKGELTQRGIIDNDFKRVGRIDVETSEEVRKFLNSLTESTTPRGRMIIRDLKQSIDQGVEDAVGSDIFAEARASNVKLNEIIKRQKRDKRDVTRGSLMEDILNNKIPEERIVAKVKTARDDDFAKLKQFYLNDAGDAGIQAWNNLKGQVLRDAVDSATSTQGKREGGVPVFNVNKFKQQLAPLRKGKKYNELFSKAERDLIDDIEEIGNLRVPVSGTFSGEGPSSQAIIKSAILNRIPGVSRKAGGLRDSLQAKKETERAINVTKETEKALRRAR